jgi:hypothetical protein
MPRCYWCRSPALSDYPCCVPAWLFQINVQETARQMLESLDLDVIGLLDETKFVPPDNVEE